MLHQICLISLLFFMISACGEGTVIIDPEPCSVEIEVNDTKYDQAKSAMFQFISFSLVDDCLILKISSSGCDGNTWNGALIGNSNVAESSPEQRYVRFVLDNIEECDAVIQRQFQFDISNLQIENDGTLIVNIDDHDQAITYTY